jgi:hypothetical protein
MHVERLTPATEDRAVEVLTLLADRGQHRGHPFPISSSPRRLNWPT